jgi:glycosyltransferase involved in cell wall biosynthesis
MRIAVNTRFSGLPESEGYAKFTNGLILNMSDRNPADEYILMYDRPVISPIRGSNITTLISGPRARHPLLWKWWYDITLHVWQIGPGAEVIFSPDGFCSLTSSIPQVLAIHDLSFLHYPQGISSLYRRYYQFYTPAFIRKATRIVTVSEFSAQDIIRHYPAAKGKISVIYNAAEEMFKPVDWQQREHDPGAFHSRQGVFFVCRSYSSA